MAPPIYDGIGRSFSNLQDLPSVKVASVTIEHVLGDLTNFKCLDLACVLGIWA